MKFINTRSAAILSVMLGAGSLQAMDLRQVVDFQGAFGYTSDVGTTLNPGSLDSTGTPGHLLYLPVLTLAKDEYFAPVMMIDAKDDERVVIEDTFLKETVDFVAKPAWKYLDDAGNMATLYGTAKRRVAKSSADEAWSEGFYDYEEYGGGFGYSKAQVLGLKSLGWDLSLVHRSYPNWHNASVQNPVINLNYNYYEKDMLIPSLALNAALPTGEHGSMTISYLLELRNYTDSNVILPESENAVDPSLRRMDTYHSLNINASKVDPYWSHSLNLGADYYLSNQNYWDSLNSQYFDDYYSFYSFTVSPELSWLIQGKPDGHKISLSYQGVFRNYVHRNIRNADASQVSKGAESDVENLFVLSGTYVVTKWLNIFANASHDMNRSNQEYEPTVKYSYDLFHIEAGVGLHY